MSNKNEEVGARLKAVRLSLGESQAVFAERLGVQRTSVASFEEGRTSMDLDQLAKLNSEKVDAAYVAFGVPSMDLREKRHEFAHVLKWVGRKTKALEFELDMEDQVDIAWAVFAALMRKQVSVRQADLDGEIQRAVSAIL